MSFGTEQEAKKVTTYDLEGNENGFLIELFKSKDETKTEAYMTCISEGGFKGFHLHRVRAARYFCLKGKVKIVLYKPGNPEKEEYFMDVDTPKRLFIPKDIATGLYNIGQGDAWLVNYPDPAYDPELKDEQVEYTEEELLQGVVK